METTLYASKVLDNQWWNVDQGTIGSKIFYSNQIIKQVNSLGLQRQRDTVKYKASYLAFLLLMKTLVVIADDITCPYCIWIFWSCFQKVFGIDNQIGLVG
jgi:hypothetical protein